MNKIITISREFGSGGREIGKRIADELGFQYYDKELITEIAKETGMSEEYIKNISEKGDCIIVGGGANVILKDFNTMNIFVYADMDSKINRCHKKAKENEHLTDKEMRKKITEIDKSRRNYHKVISNLEWGDKSNYHLCVNTTNMEIKNMIPALAKYIEIWFGGK